MKSFNPSSISFTDAAVSHFKNSLNGKPESFGIRIGVREAGCSGYEYFFEYTNEEQEGDILFDESSFKIYVDSNSFEFLKGSEVDFVSTGLNQGIIFNNPNAKVTCGCGESFSILYAKGKDLTASRNLS